MKEGENAWQQKKKMSPKKQKKRGGEKAKRKSQHCCVTCKPKPKFCVLRMPERRGVNI